MITSFKNVKRRLKVTCERGFRLSSFKDMPIDVGVIYQGQRIRFNEMQVELGGPNSANKFELVQVREPSVIEDGRVAIEGPDLNDMKEKSTHPFGILIEVAGPKLEKDLEGVVERRIHEYFNFIEGVMHVNQRYDIQIRISRASFQKGLNSFKLVGRILELLFKSELPIIERFQITFITDPLKVAEMRAKAIGIYEDRDERTRGLLDEGVDEFYGCVLCQSFAPSHVCVVSPNRYGLCGSVSWFDARASSRVDPKGPNFRVEKGECLDSTRGEYRGVDDAVSAKSMGEVKRVSLYSMFDFPHTSCGCFEAIAFYIPELEGVGIVDRDFSELCVNGLSFSTMSDHTGGGKQTRGFNGVSIEYMRSPKFLKAEGGWGRIIWVPSRVKERIAKAIPQGLSEKIATEKDAKTIDELRTFLKEKDHPVVKSWIARKTKLEAKTEEAPLALPSQEGEIMIPSLPLQMGGFKITLKNVKIRAEKVIIRRE